MAKSTHRQKRQNSQFLFRLNGRGPESKRDVNQGARGTIAW